MKITKEVNSKANHGITLIALIITIIVMLILVAVTITMTVNGGLFGQAASAGTQTNERVQEELEYANVAGMTTQDLINKYTKTTEGDVEDEEEQKEWPTSQYIGCYADLDNNGKIEVDKDGIIYADMAKGNTKGTEWGDGNGVYTIPVKTNLKEYNLSEENVTGPFGPQKVVTLANNDETKNDRFYVMALENFNEGDYDSFYWDKYRNVMEFGTSNAFETGKENTELLIKYWDNYEGKTWDNQDIWKNLSANSRWFVPSRAEWSAFGQELGITSENYYNYGLGVDYWSSSQSGTTIAWGANFSNGFMSSNSVYFDSLSVRLSTTF